MFERYSNVYGFLQKEVLSEEDIPCAIAVVQLSVREFYHESVDEVGDWTWHVIGIEQDWCRFASLQAYIVILLYDFSNYWSLLRKDVQ